MRARQSLSAMNPIRVAPDGSLPVWLLGVLFLLPGAYFFLHGQYSLLVALMVFTVLLMTWVVNRTLSVALTFAFMVLLGDIRRIVSWVGASSGLDPLLIVGAVVSVYLAIPILIKLRVSDTLSKAVLALMAVMFLEIFNPKQGGVIVGISGGLYYIVPLLWFWIARKYATEKMAYTVVYRVFLPLGVLDALLGIYQTYVGFFPWEDAWNKMNGVAFTIGHYRAFGFSTSAPEFSSTLLIASICVLAAAFSGRRAYALLLPILLTASVLASSRGLLVKLIFAAAVVWAVRGKSIRVWLPRLGFALAIGFGVAFFSASSAESTAPVEDNSRLSTADAATLHVTQGLAHPTDAKYSTGGMHWQIFVDGIISGFTYPIGIGIGGVTLGAGKFGTGGYSSEVDISDAFITMGFVGGLLYVAVIFMTLKIAVTGLRTKAPTLAWAYIGILAALFGNWIPLGQYAIAPFVWFCIGALSREDRTVKAAAQIKLKPATPALSRAAGLDAVTN